MSRPPHSLDAEPNTPTSAPLSGEVKGRVLVIDDDAPLVELITEALEESGYSVERFTDPREALTRAMHGDHHALITDVRMQGLSGLQLCAEVRRARPELPVVVLTAFGTLDTAVEAMRAGAFDFLSKPIDLDALEWSVARAVSHGLLQGELKRLRALQEETPEGLGEMWGESVATQRARERLRRAARVEAPVLITGETGTGKEVAARALHAQSGRAGEPFVAVNCAALPEQLLESELFGHAKGAFTDAKGSRKGLFLEAGAGTLLLDEVGEMPLALQPKLLRALQEGAVRPVGSDQTVQIRCRVVCATNRDLKRAALEGSFRSDLYYRVAVIRLELPPLRERVGDVLLLAQRFLDRATARMGLPQMSMSGAAARAMLAYSWPGNIRELENCVEQAVAMTEHSALQLDDLPEEVSEGFTRALMRDPVQPDGLLSLEELERQHIARVLKAVDGNKSAAAQILGVDRSTLYRKLDRGG